MPILRILACVALSASAQAATDALGCVASYHAVTPTTCTALGDLAYCLADAEAENQDVKGFLLILAQEQKKNYAKCQGDKPDAETREPTVRNEDGNLVFGVADKDILLHRSVSEHHR
jgi:hypothetical protein